eukprot:365300-Chlamydomonas_euryale.AAC.6
MRNGLSKLRTCMRNDPGKLRTCMRNDPSKLRTCMRNDPSKLRACMRNDPGKLDTCPHNEVSNLTHACTCTCAHVHGFACVLAWRCVSKSLSAQHANALSGQTTECTTCKRAPTATPSAHPLLTHSLAAATTHAASTMPTEGCILNDRRLSQHLLMQLHAA